MYHYIHLFNSRVRAQSALIMRFFFSIIVAVKKGCPTEGELIRLSRKTSEKWKKLGRQLGFKECDLIAIEQDNAGQLVEKAYAMLRQWTQWKGRYATYKALYKALCDGSVQRRDLAQEFCCASSSPVAC